MTAFGARTRLAAPERRQALLEAALRVFSAGGYGGATTAEIARRAGVSEPILYRHFDSKRALYLACLEEGWSRFREAIEEAIARTEDPADWPLAVSQAARDFHEREKRFVPANLWIQALGEATDDPSAEAWISLSIGLLRSACERLGGVAGKEEFARIGASRSRWLSGRA